MSRVGRMWLALAAVVVTALASAGCSSSDAGSLEVKEGTVVIDVRTPAEYAQGHLDGAVNMDVQDNDFGAMVAALDPHGHYILYCRTGKRADYARSIMEERGFTDVENAGGLERASQSTGLKVVS